MCGVVWDNGEDSLRVRELTKFKGATVNGGKVLDWWKVLLVLGFCLLVRECCRVTRWGIGVMALNPRQKLTEGRECWGLQL